MSHNSFHRFSKMILGLVFALSACAPAVETSAITTIPTAFTPSPSPIAVLPVITLEEHGVRFRYPPEYQVVIFDNSLCLSPVQEYGPPGPCHVQNFGLEILPSDGRSLEDAADEADARGNPDIEVKRTPLTVAGQEAILLDDIYSVDILRMVVIVYGDRIYTLTFTPWDPNQADSSPMGILFNTIINSFEFLDTAPVQPSPEPSSNLTFFAADTYTSTSPYGEWTAEVAVIQFVEKDYARLKVIWQQNESRQEWTPYEEWSETGLGDSYLSDLHWSPDGRYLYFTHQGNADGCGDPFVTHLRRVDLQNGSLGGIALTGIGLDILTLSPQVDRLVYRTADGFLIRSLETGEEYTLPYKWREEHDYLVGGYAWSPDGKTLAFTLTQEYCLPDPSEVSGTSIRLIDLETGEEQILTDRDPRFLTVTGWPEARKLQVYQDGSRYLLDIDSGALTPDPSATPVN